MASHYVNKIAPTNLHSPFGMSNQAGPSGTNGVEGEGEDQYFTFTVGKLDAGMAILIGDRASQIEFPSLLLPSECTTGSVVRISVARNQKEEVRKKREFDELQENVLEMFGMRGPVAPSLQLRAVTQTSITLEWDKLDIATAKLLSLDIFRNNERLAAIPNPLHNTSTKLSGLEVNKPYSFHLVMRTTAGTFTSNVIKTKTHDMNDTSGISVCFGYMDGSHIDEDGEYIDGELESGVKQLLQQLGAKWSDKIQIDTTHYVCTHPRGRATPGIGEGHPAGQMRGAMFSKAAQLSIPIVLPHWIYACAESKKLVPISQYYMDKEPPNAAQVRKSIGRKSIPSTPNDIAVGREASAATGGESIPPTPATKDGNVPPPPPPHKEEDLETHTEGVGREPEAHPRVEEVEGPITQTIAVPEGEREDAIGQGDSHSTAHTTTDSTPAVAVETQAEGNTNDLHASESTGGLSTGEDKMDEISLGGGESVKGDADGEEEEIDLS